MIRKQRAVVVCPGRGCYNKEQLGYLATNHSHRHSTIETIDAYRQHQGFLPVSTLDGQDKFSMQLHTKGENAAALIYACAISDHQAIDLNQFDICAVTGNSMGWYIALAATNALSPIDSIRLVNTMGAAMTDELIGGQLIYPVADTNWIINSAKREQVLKLIDEVNQQTNYQLYLSIDLGPFMVLAGCDNGLSQFEQRIDKIDNYPMRLANHGAFHSPMLRTISDRAFTQLPATMFNKPSIALIDGNGNLWSPYACDTEALQRYTLDNQVCDSYYFNRAIDVAIKEYSPDVFIILGPGNSLSSSVAQRLIELKWQGIDSKAAFVQRQKNKPIIIAMGVPEQRQLATIN